MHSLGLLRVARELLGWWIRGARSQSWKLARLRFRVSGAGVTTGDESHLPKWRKSSACEHTACVEVQFDHTVIRVRSSRWPGQTVEFTIDEWDAFLLGAAAGEFSYQSAST